MTYGHCLSNFNNSRYFWSPWTFPNLKAIRNKACLIQFIPTLKTSYSSNLWSSRKRKKFFFYLNLHPTLEIVSKKVGSDSMEHVHLEGSKRNWLLIKVVPSTSELASLIPNFLHERIKLDNDRIFHKRSWRSWSWWSIDPIRICTGAHAASIQINVKGCTQVPWARGQVDAVWIGVIAFGEDETIEGSIKLNVDPHVRLFTLDLEYFDLGHVVLGLEWPVLVPLRQRGMAVGLKVAVMRRGMAIGSRWAWRESLSVFCRHCNLIRWDWIPRPAKVAILITGCNLRNKRTKRNGQSIPRFWL